jgi:hypothetical protein
VEAMMKAGCSGRSLACLPVYMAAVSYTADRGIT